MSPEAVFSKSSKKRYEAVRRTTNNMTVPEGWVIIPGRDRPSESRREGVWVDVRYYSERAPGASYEFRRYYFDNVPTKREVRQTVNLLYLLLRWETKNA